MIPSINMKHVTECVQEPFLIPLLITDEKYQKKARYCNHRKNIQSFYCNEKNGQILF